MIRRALLPAMASAFVLLAACGSDDPASGDGHTDHATGSTSATASPEDGAPAGATALNDAEIEFAQGMIAHHEQAIEMAEMALDPAMGAGTEVVDLATRIQAAQDPEIDLMTGWLEAAGQPVAMDTSDGHDMSEMDGMMSAEQMDALGAATGTDFDRMWLEMMIEHHEGATSQAEDVRDAGANPDVLALADAIIATQQAEITEMQGLLDA